MKTQLKDFILAALAISLILSVTILFLYLLNIIITPWLGRYSLLVSIFSSFLLYGLISALYLNVLQRFFPLEEGIFDMDHWQFTLWKHHAVISQLGRHVLKLFFPVFLRSSLYAILGANIGKFTAVGGVITDPILTKVEDYGVLGQDSVVTSHTMVYNRFYLKSVVVCKGATVGINAVLMPGVRVGENSVVAPGAVVLMDTVIPPNEFWGGIPAHKIKDSQPA